MKKRITGILTSSAMTAAVMAASGVVASAEGEVYGTLQIPYATFFQAEFEGAGNAAAEVDAVSSATTGKWKMNQTGAIGEDGKWTPGGLAAGTYCEEGENGGGKILGVVYPVKVAQEDVAFLTEHYQFTPLDAQPAAYKEITVTDGKITAGKLVDTDGAQNISGEVKVQTQTNYGDYQLDVANYPQDADVYGAIVKTADGNMYGMRALENLWRPKGEIAWSVGYVTQTHGNNIDNPDYHPTNGATVTEVTFITLDGYRTVETNQYLPVLFTAGVSVENGKSGDGSVTFDNSIFPADFQQSGAVADGFTVSGNMVSYTGAQPGSYTLTVSDTSGKYGDVRGNFKLETADIPVKYQDGKLVAADGFTDADAANYLKNITTVKVGEKSYNTGRRGTTVIDGSTGEVLFDAKAQDTPVFDGSGNYTVTVTATGYTSDYTFTTVQESDSSASSSESSGGSSSSSSSKSLSRSSNGGTSSSAQNGNVGSPKTAEGSVLPIAAATAACAGIAAVVLCLKKKD